MGQPVVVAEKPSASHRGVVRFETNRPLSGMGHERYRSAADTFGDRPVDVLARRLFERGGIEAVHINGNVITVDLSKGYTSEGIRELIEGLFLFYGPGAPGELPEVTPVEPADPEAAAAAAAAAAPHGAAAAPTGAAVPGAPPRPGTS